MILIEIFRTSFKIGALLLVIEIRPFPSTKLSSAAEAEFKIGQQRGVIEGIVCVFRLVKSHECIVLSSFSEV